MVRNRLLRFFPPIILLLFLGVIYALTLAPGLTWANSSTDGGDLIAAAATGGVAHPTGYPTWFLLARLFQLLPFGSLAFRTNLLSAVAALAAALFVYLLIQRALASLGETIRCFSALVGALAWGLSPLIWSQAVVTEVYALHAFFMALLLYLFYLDALHRIARPASDRWIGLLFGLGLGNHLTTLFLLPVLFVTVFLRRRSVASGRWFFLFNGHSLARRFAWLALGSLVYLSLPIRALTNPPVNWGDPRTLADILWLVSGRLYAGYFFTLDGGAILPRLQAQAALLLDQFGALGLFVSLAGLILFFRRSPIYFALIWLTLVSIVFALGYASADAYLYLIPAFLSFSIWLGFGLAGLLSRFLVRWRGTVPVLSLVLLLALLFHAGTNWQDVDASQDGRAEAFIQDVISSVPEDAILFANGDQAVFSLWYAQYAIGEREDVVIIASDLLQFPWYARTLRSTYPQLSLPVDYPFPETVVVNNPGHPVCYVEYEGSMQLTCDPPREP